MTRTSWDEYFVEMAKLVATRSKDPNTHIGAVIVGPDNEVLSTGYNSFPRGINDDVPERSERPEKYFWFEHAERNAIYNATLMGVSLNNCRMYANASPCMDCARGIVQSGIKELIVDSQGYVADPEKWDDHFKRSFEMFDEAGVKIRKWEGKIVEVNKFVRRKIHSFN